MSKNRPFERNLHNKKGRCCPVSFNCVFIVRAALRFARNENLVIICR